MNHLWKCSLVMLMALNLYRSLPFLRRNRTSWHHFSVVYALNLLAFDSYLDELKLGGLPPYVISKIIDGLQFCSLGRPTHQMALVYPKNSKSYTQLTDELSVIIKYFKYQYTGLHDHMKKLFFKKEE